MLYRYLMKTEELQARKSALGDGWKVVDDHHLEREWTFPDFAAALALVNRIGALAEEANHHPDIYLTWGKVRITLYSHDIGGLSSRDFNLAARIDQLE